MKSIKTKKNNKPTWTMIEPFPNDELLQRYNVDKEYSGSWKETGLLDTVQHVFFQKLSLDQTGLLDHIEDESYDFIYLDGDHSYKGVKQELPLFWDKVRPGGVLAGHDYCNYGERSLSCSGCDDIPKCLPYTEYGIASGKSKTGNASNQQGVVQAVQEWLVEMGDDELMLYHTNEDFTRESLTKDDMDYDLVITNTRNPSWFIVKPLNNRWNKEQIVSYMKEHPNRAYFSRFFRDGGFQMGMEVGVADGRF